MQKKRKMIDISTEEGRRELERALSERPLERSFEKVLRPSIIRPLLAAWASLLALRYLSELAPNPVVEVISNFAELIWPLITMFLVFALWLRMCFWLIRLLDKPVKRCMEIVPSMWKHVDDFGKSRGIPCFGSIAIFAVLLASGFATGGDVRIGIPAFLIIAFTPALLLRDKALSGFTGSTRKPTVQQTIN